MALGTVTVDLTHLAIGDPAAIRRAFIRLGPLTRKIAKQWTERAEKNAPILSGDLRKGLTVVPVLDVVRLTITWEAGGTAPYTLRMHEAVYNLGPRSKRQPGTPEGGVGRKYFSRVLAHWEDQWLTQLATEFGQYLVEENL
jgi:hypothetical protein